MEVVFVFQVYNPYSESQTQQMYDLNNLYLSMMTNETHKDDQDDDAVLAKEDVADET